MPPATLITHAAELLTLQQGSVPRRGAAMRELSIIPDGAVAVEAGRIVAVGPTADLERHYSHATRIDAAGKVVMPGMIDPHTHVVFAGSREQEFEMRVQGKTYPEIAAAGGGILSSVRQFRAASEADLTAQTARRLRRFLVGGVTTVEAKSGYGLTLEDELKALRVLRDLRGRQPVDIIATFLGAHEVPAEYRARRAEYIDLVIQRMLPEVAKTGLAEFCDVFCEQGVFDIAESRRILLAARQLGFKLKLHADEFAPLGGAELAAEVGAVSADHLMAATPAGIAALAKSDTVAVLLPATSFHLGLTRYADARAMIDGGAAVALSTDCNPGSSMTESLLFVINLAAAYLKMTADESITACTVNAAAAVARGDSLGRLAPGLAADILILDIPNHRYLPYHVGYPAVETVIKNGAVVYRRSEG